MDSSALVVVLDRRPRWVDQGQHQLGVIPQSVGGRHTIGPRPRPPAEQCAYRALCIEAEHPLQLRGARQATSPWAASSSRSTASPCPPVFCARPGRRPRPALTLTAAAERRLRLRAPVRRHNAPSRSVPASDTSRPRPTQSGKERGLADNRDAAAESLRPDFSGFLTRRPDEAPTALTGQSEHLRATRFQMRRELVVTGPNSDLQGLRWWPRRGMATPSHAARST